MGGEVARGQRGEDRRGLLAGQRRVVELTGDERGNQVHVAGGVHEGVVAHRGGLQDRARAEDDEKGADESGDDGPERGLEALEALIPRMGQRSCYTQNRIGAHGCAARVGTRHARSPFGTLPSVRSGDVPHPRESLSVESEWPGLSSLELS